MKNKAIAYHEAPKRFRFHTIVEQGKATTWAMLICVAAIAAYIKFGREFFNSTLAPIYHTLIVATLAVLALFTLGCVVNMILVGDKSYRQLRKDLKSQVSDLRAFLIEAQTRTAELDALASRYAHTLRPSSRENLNQAKRITSALAVRAEEVMQFIDSGRKVDIIDAFELLNSDLSVIENCMDSLIGSNPIPALSPDVWLPTIRNLLDSVVVDLERVAA